MPSQQNSQPLLFNLRQISIPSRASTLSATTSNTTTSNTTPSSIPRVCAIIPALNEQACIEAVIHGLLDLSTSQGRRLIHEVIVANNGSTDQTASLAVNAGARVINVPERGYGRACWEAAKISNSDIFLYVDGDGAADPQDAHLIIEQLNAGADLVIGVRNQPEPGSMTTLQIFGNRLACTLMSLIWGLRTQDLGPYRAVRRDAYLAIDMQDRSYGWTVEMQVRAHCLGLVVKEVPVSWHARTGGASKVSGTLRGAVGAGLGILGMIARIWLLERRRPANQKIPFHQPQIL